MKNINKQEVINILNGRHIYNNAKHLFDFFKVNNIKYAVMKGEPLSIMAYKANGQRIYGDLDILISRKNISIVSSYLLGQGYKHKMQDTVSMNERTLQIFCLSSSHQMLPYIQNNDNYPIEIDLNFDIFWGEYKGERIDIETELLSDTIDMIIYNNPIKTLNPLKSFLHLVLHHYKDMNSIYLLAFSKKSYINNSNFGAAKQGRII